MGLAGFSWTFYALGPYIDILCNLLPLVQFLWFVLSLIIWREVLVGTRRLDQ